MVRNVHDQFAVKIKKTVDDHKHFELNTYNYFTQHTIKHG